jgi:hypothetical protein
MKEKKRGRGRPPRGDGAVVIGTHWRGDEIALIKSAALLLGESFAEFIRTASVARAQRRVRDPRPASTPRGAAR